MKVIYIVIFSITSGKGLSSITWGSFKSSPKNINRKPFAKATLSRNEVLQYRGNNAASKLKQENPLSERKGESLCSIRPLGCCDGVDLQCFGCHPGLLDMGIPCGQQPIHDEYSSLRRESTRDCFCDRSCLVFDDCCDDHMVACIEFYDVSMLDKVILWRKLSQSFQIPKNCERPVDKPKDFNPKSSCKLRGSCCSGGDHDCYGCNPVLLSKGIPCEQQTTVNTQDVTTDTTARDCFCDTICILFKAKISNRRQWCWWHVTLVDEMTIGDQFFIKSVTNIDITPKSFDLTSCY